MTCLVALQGCRVGGSPSFSISSYRSKALPAFSYEILTPSGSAAEDTVLYYFHGAGGGIDSWYSSNRGVIDEWKRSGSRIPIVVAVSCGPLWYLYPSSAKQEWLPLEDFVRVLMPEIENAIGAREPHRYLYGFSMGANNAAQLVFRYPELFERAALASPGVYPYSPFSSEATARSLAEQAEKYDSGIIASIRKAFGKHAFRDAVLDAINEHWLHSREMFPNEAEWEKADFLHNIVAKPIGKDIKIYISSGRQDAYGLFPGAISLADAVSNHGYSVQFDALNGGHVRLDSKAIAKFLAVPQN